MSASSASQRDSDSCSPVGPADVKVVLPPGRHPRLPCIYIMENHPKYDGRAYYFIHDASFDASREIYRLEVEEFKIPQGPRVEAIEMGLCCLFIYWISV